MSQLSEMWQFLTFLLKCNTRMPIIFPLFYFTIRYAAGLFCLFIQLLVYFGAVRVTETSRGIDAAHHCRKAAPSVAICSAMVAQCGSGAPTLHAL
jgi:hypothetical protein